MRPLHRRTLLAALPALAGCAGPMAELSSQATTQPAADLLREAAAAHGAAAFAKMSDISVSYAGEWRALVDKLQPALVDAGFRGGSQERLLLRERLVGQAHSGPDGHKQVVRRTSPKAEGEVRVWFNDTEATDLPRRDGAALVADAYSLFLLGPMLLAGPWAADRMLTMELAGIERVRDDAQLHDCDVLRIRTAPGLGLSGSDHLELMIDRDRKLMRRVRFTLDGLESTRGAVAEVDCADHVLLAGVLWPTRFHEQLLRPLSLPVHDWRMTGLDVDRGLTPAEASGPRFTGRALAPATSLLTRRS